MQSICQLIIHYKIIEYDIIKNGLYLNNIYYVLIYYFDHIKRWFQIGHITTLYSLLLYKLNF